MTAAVAGLISWLLSVFVNDDDLVSERSLGVRPGQGLQALAGQETAFDFTGRGEGHYLLCTQSSFATR
ncbi:hypothetical protein ABZX93_32665 [Streptomyces sp. NPDC006632]|uniref:hypothetical protein n=1 Tax=Streptomyces sp. NPDC006632 TaxID=3157182 RepID=UPI0033A599D8